MKNKKSIIALLIVVIIGIVGLTLAYFSNSDTIENQFITKEYGSTYTEEFVSPDNWLPGDTTNKTIVVENTGDVDEAVRISYTESWTTHNNGTLNGWIHPDGTKSTHTTETELSTDESVAIINLANTSDWTKVGDYCYYNYKLAPGESTTSFLESVTFNSKTKLDDTCVTTIDGSTKTVTCNSSGDDYDNATYTLTFTIETVQYNKYADAWNTGNTVTIAESRPVPGAQILLSKINAVTETNYSDGNIHEMYTFEHEATAQTPALTDYRYIGNDPYNYVKFNCDNDGTNCEIWRIIGVFDVDDGTGNVEQRIKLVRGSVLDNEMQWDGVGPGSSDEGENDWSAAYLKNFLNGDYYNSLGDALTKGYGLKESARNMIDDAKFYLGANNSIGSTEEIYAWERGTTVYTGRPTKWIGKVALMYPSDYGYTYALNIDNICYLTPINCSEYEVWDDEIEKVDNIGYPTKSWIYNSNMISDINNIKNVYLLSTNLGWFNYVLIIRNIGNIGIRYAYENIGSIRPVVYLSSNVQIIDGDGTVSSPYKLSL